MNKLYLNVFAGIPEESLYKLTKEIGFDGYFGDPPMAARLDELSRVKALGDAEGLDCETLHATIPGSATLWSDGSAGDEFVCVLKTNIDNCKILSIPILVVHISPDFTKEPSFETGIRRLEAVVAYARENGIRIAFENINSPEYLYRTMEHFDSPDVGFCYDVGHEACHTLGERYLPRLGHRLMCTHLHDNDNADDLHLIPFDGDIDLAKMCEELKACQYEGNITLEVFYSKEYKAKMSEREYVEKCYAAAKKIRDMIRA